MFTQEGFGANPLFLLIVTLFLVGMYFYWRKLVADQKDRKAQAHDPRAHIVNDSNYNIAQEGIDGHRTGEMNAEEAQEVIEKLKASDYVPTRKEFQELRKDLKK